MSWALIIGLSWLVIAVVAALVIGRMVRTADLREHTADDGPRPDGMPEEEPLGIIAEAPPERPGVRLAKPTPLPAPHPGRPAPSKRRVAHTSGRGHLPWSGGISSGRDSGAA